MPLSLRTECDWNAQCLISIEPYCHNMEGRIGAIKGVGHSSADSHYISVYTPARSLPYLLNWQCQAYASRYASQFISMRSSGPISARHALIANSLTSATFPLQEQRQRRDHDREHRLENECSSHRACWLTFPASFQSIHDDDEDCTK